MILSHSAIDAACMGKTLVISRVFPPEVGGNGRWMWELYSRLPRDEYLIAAGQYPGDQSFDAAHGLSIVRLPLHLDSWGAFGWRRGTAYYGLHSTLRRVVREHKIERVHASNCLPEGFLAWTLRRRIGLPYLVFAHGEELAIAATSRELEWMARRAYGDAALVIANSRNTARMLVDRWNVSAANVCVIHPGIDTHEYRPVPPDPSERRRLGWHNRRVILTVGRLMKRKGHAAVLRAMPEISRSIPDVLYAIVGDGEERASLEQLSNDLKLKDRVLFHGELDNERVKIAHQQSDLFVMANREVDGEVEGFGIVLLEAQACGKPVIAGDSGGTAEAVNAPHTGRIVPQDRPDELARTIVELLRDQALCERMGRLGREWVERRFDWTVLVPQVSAAFCEKSARATDLSPSELTAVASR
jgi:phosphatidylinositol alpha-1,6-mannosyltransferase